MKGENEKRRGKRNRTAFHSFGPYIPVFAILCCLIGFFALPSTAEGHLRTSTCGPFLTENPSFPPVRQSEYSTDTLIFHNLEECIRYAVAHSVTLRTSALETEIIKAGLESAKAALLPVITAGTGTIFRETGISGSDLKTAPLSEKITAGLDLRWTIWDGGSALENLRNAKEDLKLADVRTGKAEESVRIRTAEAYTRLLIGKSIIEAARESVRKTHLELERAERLVHSGKAAKAVLPEIRAQAARENALLTNASGTWMIDMLKLCSIIGAPAGTRIRISENPQRRLPPPPGQTLRGGLLESAEKSRYVQEAAIRFRKSEIGYAYSAGAFFPRLEITAGLEYPGNRISSRYSRRKNEDLRSVIRNTHPYFSVRLSVPVFNGSAARTGRKKSRILRDISRIRYEESFMEERRNAEEMFCRAEMLYQETVAADRSAEAAEEALRQISEKFSSGLCDATDYSAAKANHIRALSEYFRARCSYILQLQIIEIYCRK